MVELTRAPKSMKRKRTDKKKAIFFDTFARYPASFLLSALTYKQASESLCISPRSVLISVPTPPNKTQFNAIAGDLFSLDEPIRKIPIKLMEHYHKQHTITHMQWNQKGNTVASVDETGQLALWSIENSVHEWELIYNTDLKQPLAAFLWLNAERLYTQQSDNSLKKEPVAGPRNPYGQLAFVTATVHGEIKVHFQRNGSIFSSFSTPIPNIGRREISRADAGCFGMSLAGLDDWERISHSAITMNKDGNIYLASHNASLQPKSVSIHSIRIMFPKKINEKGAIECKSISILKIQKQPFENITHMAFKHDLSVELVIGTGQLDASYLSTWQLRQIKKTIQSDFGTIVQEFNSLIFQSGIKIHGRFISSLTTSREGNATIVGLSDGSIHTDISTRMGALRNTAHESSIDPRFYQITKPRTAVNGDDDPVADTALSPNETHIIYSFLSGKIGVSKLTDDSFTDEYVNTITRKLQLCLLNNTDYLDLVSELVCMTKLQEHKEKVNTIVKNVLDSHEMHYNGSKELSNRPLEEWSLASLEKAYGFAMAVYSRLPDTKIQSINFSKAIQLPLILECFIGSCTTEITEIRTILDKQNIDTNDRIEFDSNSLWSLVSLSTWIYDYLKWILREWVLAIQHEVITLEDNIEFLNALDSLKPNNTDVENRWSLLLSSNLKNYTLADIQKLSDEYRDKCAKPSIYIGNESLYRFDVIRKRRLPSNVNTIQCMRCHQPTLRVDLEKDMIDPCFSAQWYQSIGKHCVCAGLFY
ncbi:hypothetical protein [Parasitella parasitica]|uniref:Mediator complex subunit 16 n=1 Tax=Parasitella parasitica TaxID=35722 RepID=A0A0B7NEE9_9FUNG|nr:hypothetical protein [Parasitella parasitica]